ncbi:MAG: tetratricopeptide repeat protein [Desulfobulbales bacterium]|nr:tetratricopeptide repeat protein [Desulfobulbales bacterium]
MKLQTGGSLASGPLPCLLFAIVVFLLYSNTFQSPYIFDDWYHIEANPHIRMTDFSLDALKRAAFDSPLHRRPLAYVSLALNYYFGGYELFGYHIVNILIHLGAAIFLYLFLQTTFSMRESQKNTKYGDWLPFFAALIWLVHPLHVQSVTYIIQRMNSMAAMFYILALLFYVRARLAQSRAKRLLLFSGCFCAGVLALGSKEIAATLPLFILLYEWFFLQDLSFSWLRKRILPLLGIGLFLSMAAILLWDLNLVSSIINSYNIRDFNMMQRILTEFRVVLFYVSLLLLPHPGRLNIDHDFQLSLSLVDPVTTCLSLAVLLVLFGLATVLAQKERLLSFCIFWFLGNLVIESSVIGLEIIFEHRTYLPSMLAIPGAVIVGKRILPTRLQQISLALTVLVIFSFWTYERNTVWRDEVTLRRDAAAKSPAKARALAILANALERNHEYEEAAFYYRKTLNLNPGNADEINYNLGNVLMAQRKIDQAVEHFKTARRLNPDAAPIRLNLANALAMQGQTLAAYAELQELIRLHPREPRAHNNFGMLLLQLGRPKEAVFHFSEALRLQPKYAQARSNLEAAMQRMKNVTPSH